MSLSYGRVSGWLRRQIPHRFRSWLRVPDVLDNIVERLRAAFLAFAGAETADLRKRLCLEGFAPVDLTEYELIPRWEMKRKRPGTTTQAESFP